MKRGKTGSIAAVLCSVVIGLPAGILLLLGEDPCEATGDVPAPSAAAQNGIPDNYLALYQDAGRTFGLPWTLLAAIGSIETDHGRLDAPGVTSGANHAGAMGPMQFLAGTWRAYGVDGDDDGDQDVYDPRDAIPGAANYLRASGAPGDLHGAIYAYNHAEWYVQKVLAGMRHYAATASAAASANATGLPVAAAGALPAATPAGDCSDLGGITAGAGDGTFTIAPDANRPGVSLTPAMAAFVSAMATFYDGHLVVSTGTNHAQYTLGGNQSDHWLGNGVDFGMAANGGTDDGPVGDRIAAAVFLAAGLPRDVALVRARAGGAHTIVSNGLRIQVIWKSDVGGNHHNHVHVGIGRAG
jgi:hypothetical protein